MSQLAARLVQQHLGQARAPSSHLRFAHQPPPHQPPPHQPAHRRPAAATNAMPHAAARRPAVRPEADAVDFIRTLLRRNEADVRLSANFSAQSGGRSVGPKRLDIRAASATDRNLAYAALANLNSTIPLTSGGTAQIRTSSANPLVRGQPNEFRMTILPSNGPERSLQVSVTNADVGGARR